MKKRIVSVVLILCMLFTCFATGCTKQKDNYEENSTSKENTTLQIRANIKFEQNINAKTVSPSE